MMTLMLATKYALYDLADAGLIPLNGDLTLKFPCEYADKLAEAACKNSGHKRVLRVYYNNGAGGLFADVE
jgi:hypothetical protein